MNFLKKFKRFNPLEPSLTTFGFFFLSVIFIGCFFYVDYKGILHSHGTNFFHFPTLSSSSSSPPPPPPVQFMTPQGDKCDVFDGNWVWDEAYPLYHSTNCSFLDQGFRCSENGRPDTFYTKWRWQPKDCDLPRFLPNPFFFLFWVFIFLLFWLVEDR